MSRLRTLLVIGLTALGALAIGVPSASAQPPSSASCLGVLSSFAGQAGIRSDFAPASGREVAALAHAHGDFAYCLSLFLGGP
jgi:hypothetical protein